MNLAHSKKHLTAQNSSKLFILPVYTICSFIHGCLLQGWFCDPMHLFQFFWGGTMVQDNFFSFSPRTVPVFFHCSKLIRLVLELWETLTDLHKIGLDSRVVGVTLSNQRWFPDIKETDKTNSVSTSGAHPEVIQPAVGFDTSESYWLHTSSAWKYPLRHHQQNKSSTAEVAWRPLKLMYILSCPKLYPKMNLTAVTSVGSCKVFVDLWLRGDWW